MVELNAKYAGKFTRGGNKVNLLHNFQVALATQHVVLNHSPSAKYSRA